jgi:hypothetical protein
VRTFGIHHGVILVKGKGRIGKNVFGIKNGNEIMESLARIMG